MWTQARFQTRPNIHLTAGQEAPDPRAAQHFAETPLLSTSERAEAALGTLRHLDCCDRDTILTPALKLSLFSCHHHSDVRNPLPSLHSQLAERSLECLRSARAGRALGNDPFLVSGTPGKPAGSRLPCPPAGVLQNCARERARSAEV